MAFLTPSVRLVLLLLALVDLVVSSVWSATPLPPPTNLRVWAFLNPPDVEAAGIFFSVKDYGAVGDGVTEDTAAVVATLAAAPDGSVIWFPGGTSKPASSRSAPPGWGP